MSPGPYDGPEYKRLLAAARRSLERTGGDLSGTVSVRNPGEAERKAIIGVTGQYRPEGVGQMTVRLADLDLAVREAAGHGLAELLERLGPPLRDLPRAREKLATGRDAMIRSADESFLAAREWYRRWVADLGRDGVLTKLVNAACERRLGQAVRVLEALDGRAEPVGLAELAAAVTGDTHALDHGTTLATLVLRALASRADLPRPASTEDRREVWDAAGVIVDDLASRVLVLNLPARGKGLGEWLSGAAALGVPFYVTLQQLVAMPVTVPAATVRVCENPAVLRRAAGALGASSSPLICAEGRPSTAFHRLAAAVVSGGGSLEYHGDFDWPGVSIAAAVIGRHGARPWRFSATDYLAGVRAGDDYVALSGTAQATPWDPPLAEAMAATGRVVYEESVADDLIADLTAR
ncbi:MAG: TIGR02679 family protein [Nocardiopsaceae bacterium]|nr:TIGR02679 family protein [Nocardiopsaceae bacterium]